MESKFRLQAQHRHRVPGGIRTVNLSEHIGRAYVKFQTGYTPIAYTLSLIGFLTFAKVWQGTFEYYGIPFTIIVVLCPILILVVAFILGHSMIYFKVQEAMQSLGNQEANKEFSELCRDVKEIKEKLK